jgi:hypothetical protein
VKLDEAHAGLVLADIWVTSCYMNITDKNTHAYVYIYILDIHWLQISFQGRLWVDFCPFSVDLPLSKQKLPFQENKYHFMFSCLSHVESARVFPPFSREFPPRKIDTFLRKVE